METIILAGTLTASPKERENTNGTTTQFTKVTLKTDSDMGTGCGKNTSSNTLTNTRENTKMIKKTGMAFLFGTTTTNTKEITSTTKDKVMAKCTGSTGPTIKDSGTKVFSKARGLCSSPEWECSQEFSMATNSFKS